MNYFWDEWRGGSVDNHTMLIKRLGKLFGCRLDLHKMVGIDDYFHSHPAWAIRVILRGGYFEEFLGGVQMEWRPGMFGLVSPRLIHRVSGFRGKLRPSYSLWLRGPVCAKIKVMKVDGTPVLLS